MPSFDTPNFVLYAALARTGVANIHADVHLLIFTSIPLQIRRTLSSFRAADLSNRCCSRMRSPSVLRRLSGQLSVPTRSPWVWLVQGADPDIASPTLHPRPSFRAEYVTPASLDHELPKAGQPEVAFAGRSNAGKSTLIGHLLGNPKLVRTSKAPGCTKTVNFFALRNGDVPQLYLVDFPGYGYAKQNKRAVREWTSIVHSYLDGRPRAVLQRIFVLVDSRHGIQPGDERMLSVLDSAQVPNQVVLTKVDKVSPHDLVRSVESACRAILSNSSSIPLVHCVSAHKGFGIEELANVVWGLKKGRV